MGRILMLFVVDIVLILLVQVTAYDYDFDDEINSILFGSTVASAPIIEIVRRTEQMPKPNKRQRQKEKGYNYNRSLFQSLENYYDKATLTTTMQYPWIAKVVHSRTTEFPFLCTASCIESRIFITSAKCLARAKIYFTSVLYKDTRFHAKVFVLSNETKQWFDDIGIIVVENNNEFKDKWDTVEFYSESRGKETPEDPFQWFKDLKFHELATKHVVIAYAFTKDSYQRKTPKYTVDLVELEVAIGVDLCQKTYGHKREDQLQFHVPCYHSCILSDLVREQEADDKKKKNENICDRIVNADGGAVYNPIKNELIGVATWGYSMTKLPYALPSGFAVPNTVVFINDLECARKIVKDNEVKRPSGYYQVLCS